MPFTLKRNGLVNGKNKLILFNQNYMIPPLDDASVERIKLQHEKKEWGYKCKDEPMCSYCDKFLCKTRPFGIGGEVTFPIPERPTKNSTR